MRKLLTIGATALALAAWGVAAAGPAGSAPTTVTFDFTTENGGVQQFTVPVGVCSITIDTQGAQGGNVPLSGGVGGLGGRAADAVTVTPGEVLQVRVGGEGQDSDPQTSTGGIGGLNGGGDGGGGTTLPGAGGGGASDVRRAPYGTESRLIVGGGGGGAETSHAGGTGGGTTGGDGIQSSPGEGTPARGGTQTAGGVGGTGGVSGEDGDTDGTGEGGDGASTGIASPGRGGGGGGGLHGGGGGAGETNDLGDFGSGAGGSGATPTGAGLTNGFRAGNGLVLISYDPAAAACPVVRFTG